MQGMMMANKLIRVEFVDAATNNVFANTEAEARSLPETFALNTAVSLSGQEWQIIAADPMTRAEYVRLGRLSLTLAKITQVPVKDIHYSLPTLYDMLPAMQPQTAPVTHVLKLNADLWRSVEFVPKSQQAAVDTEFQAIAIIYQDHREGIGFNKLHVRTMPETPIAGLIRLTELKALFASARTFDTIVFQGKTGVAKDVFAFQYGAWAFYGEHSGEAVQSLALEPQSEQASLPLDPILQLMRIYDLLLVDWINANAMPYQEANLFLKRFQKH
jgi:hypothetical protein